MSNRFNDLLRRAQDALANLRSGGFGFYLGRNGEVIYSKNNICVHTVAGLADAEETIHTPGYLSIHCQDDEQLGVTLVLQWLPNTLLQKNPTSICCVSPRAIKNTVSEEKEDDITTTKRFICSNRNRTGDSDDDDEKSKVDTIIENSIPFDIDSFIEKPEKTLDEFACFTIVEHKTASQNEVLAQGQQRPINLTGTTNQQHLGLFVPSINIIPNTPVEQQQEILDDEKDLQSKSESSEATSGEDESIEEEERDDPEEEKSIHFHDTKSVSKSFVELRKTYADSLRLGSIPERFAREHNLMLKGEIESETIDDQQQKEEEVKTNDKEREQTPLTQTQIILTKQCGRQETGNLANNDKLGSLFSVNLGKMRSMRVFYSDLERTSGQLVIASTNSQYKIFHFHHAGLDKLAALFERWNVVKAKSAGNDSPSVICPDRHLLICPAGTDLQKDKLDPEDGLYQRLDWETWRSHMSTDGSVHDAFTVKKNIFFASMDTSLRREIWPFLLRIYPWSSSYEQRDAIRNDLFLRYQRLKRNRIRRIARSKTANDSNFYIGVEQSISKDVVRTDRRNSFFAGDENTNLDIMKSILLTYAVRYPAINYIQGMSDLLAPLLFTLRDEQLAYWCFEELMKQTMFCQPNSPSNRSVMDCQLDYLRALLQLFTPDFYQHLIYLEGDATNLMFVHRWILLFFKREFPQTDSLHIWEACWSRYRTAHFHLFIACAIVSVFGPDVVAQRLHHDEILLYFSSLAMHMDARLILQKARGLLYQFHRLSRIPCTLINLLEPTTGADPEQWNSHIPIHREIECANKGKACGGRGNDGIDGNQGERLCSCNVIEPN